MIVIAGWINELRYQFNLWRMRRRMEHLQRQLGNELLEAVDKVLAETR